MGSEVEGIYGLLRGVTSCSCLLLSQPLLKRSYLTPSSTISQLPSQESTGPEASDPAGQATVSASPAPKKDILAHMQPLRIQMGVENECISARLKVAKRAHQPHRQLTICAHVRKVHLGVRLVCSLCGKTFFNPDMLRNCKNNSHLSY